MLQLNCYNLANCMISIEVYFKKEVLEREEFADLQTALTYSAVDNLCSEAVQRVTFLQNYITKLKKLGCETCAWYNVSIN